MTDEKASQQKNSKMEPEASQELDSTEEALQPVEEGVDILKNELEECKTKANEYLDGWQRARADYVNYKKRTEREQAQAYQNASAIVIRRFVEVMDDFDLAMKNRPHTEDDAGWAEGVELIYRKLAAILEAEGVSVIDTD